METGMEFAACAKPAWRVGCLENKHALAALRQIGSADQSIVSCPNNDRIVPIQSRAPFLFSYPMQTLVTACPQDFRAYTLRVHRACSGSSVSAKKCGAKMEESIAPAPDDIALPAKVLPKLCGKCGLRQR